MIGITEALDSLELTVLLALLKVNLAQPCETISKARKDADKKLLDGIKNELLTLRTDVEESLQQMNVMRDQMIAVETLSLNAGLQLNAAKEKGDASSAQYAMIAFINTQLRILRNGYQEIENTIQQMITSIRHLTDSVRNRFTIYDQVLKKKRS